jgi:carbon-monoxide dehydrogenase large subunit
MTSASTASRVAASPGGWAKQHCIYDPESGPPLAGSFMRYAMPRAGDLPYFATDISDVAATTHPLGFHGGGEGTIQST